MQFRIAAGDGIDEIGLVDAPQDHPPDRRIIERRMQLVEPDDGHFALGFQHRGADVRGLAQNRHQIVGRIFPPVVLTLLQSCEGGTLIGHRGPLDTIEVHDFRTCASIGRACGDRHVLFELGVDVARALHSFGGQIAERPTADQLRDRLVGVGFRQAFRHHRRHVGVRLAQRVRQHRERTLQAKDDGFVVGRGYFVAAFDDLGAQHVADGPASDRSDAIAGQNLFAVVPQQPVAERQAPGQTIVLDRVAGDHLRLGLERRVGAIQLVEYQPAMVTGDVGRVDVRIEERQVHRRHEAQDARLLRRHDGGGGEGRTPARQDATPRNGHSAAFGSAAGMEIAPPRSEANVVTTVEAMPPPRRP